MLTGRFIAGWLAVLLLSHAENKIVFFFIICWDTMIVHVVSHDFWKETLLLSSPDVWFCFFELTSHRNTCFDIILFHFENMSGRLCGAFKDSRVSLVTHGTEKRCCNIYLIKIKDESSMN